MKKERRLFETIGGVCHRALWRIFGVICRAQTQGPGPKFVVGPWLAKAVASKLDGEIGQVSGVCVDAQDNVFIVNRNDITWTKGSGNCAASAAVHRIRSRGQLCE